MSPQKSKPFRRFVSKEGRHEGHRERDRGMRGDGTWTRPYWTDLGIRTEIKTETGRVGHKNSVRDKNRDRDRGENRGRRGPDTGRDEGSPPHTRAGHGPGRVEVPRLNFAKDLTRGKLDRKRFPFRSPSVSGLSPGRQNEGGRVLCQHFRYLRDVKLICRRAPDPGDRS